MLMTLGNKLFVSFLITIIANCAVLLVFSYPFIKEIDLNAQKSNIFGILLSIKNDLQIKNEILNSTGLIELYLSDAQIEARNSLKKQYTQILKEGMEVDIIDLSNNKIIERINPQEDLNLSSFLDSLDLKEDILASDALVINTWNGDYYIKGLSFKPWGWAILCLISKESLFINLQKIISIFLFSTLFSIILCLIISRIVIKHFIDPLDKLKTIAKKLAQGDLDTTIPLSRSDEIGELSKAFDSMRTSIKSKIHNIRKMNNELESIVTERTKELRLTNSNLNTHIKKTKNLVRVLCHDLANSIGIVKSSNYFLKTKNPKRSREDLWKKVDLAVQNQIDLIEQVRTVEANESGKIKLQLANVDMVAILNKSKELMEYKLSEKDIKLDIPEMAHFFVYAEATSLLNNVINNLITNAIKFSFEGSTISISFESEASCQVVRIEDQGIGIPESMRVNLFDTYKETSRLGTKGEKGTGFGMPLVKAYMESYGGSISVQSTERKYGLDNDNHGTKFTLNFKRGAE